MNLNRYDELVRMDPESLIGLVLQLEETVTELDDIIDEQNLLIERYEASIKKMGAMMDGK